MRKILPALAVASLLAGTSAHAQLASQSLGDNLVINPWMEVDQVNEGATAAATVAASGTYTIVKTGDGWYVVNSNSTTGSPTIAYQNAQTYNDGAQFDAKYTVGTAEGSVGASDLLTIFQPIDPIRGGTLQYGTSNAQGSYLSFCAQSSVAGTYSYAIVPNLLSGFSATSNSIATYFNQFTLPAATKECFQFYVPPATVGTFGNTTRTVDSTHGMNLLFVLTAGSNLEATSSPNCAANIGQWLLSSSSKNCLGATGQANIALTTGATFEVTGVKWSLNPLPLAHDPGTELWQAQEYYVKTFKAGTGGVSGTKPAQNVGAGSRQWASASGDQVTATAIGIYWPFPRNLRAAPTVTTFSPRAASANCGDVTGTTVTSAATVEPNTTSNATNVQGVYIGCASIAPTTLGDEIGIGITADARL